MPDAPESLTSSHERRSATSRTYAEVANSHLDSGGELGVTRRRELVRSQQHGDLDSDGTEQLHDDMFEDEDELFLFQESLRRGDAAQQRRRLAPRRSLEATHDELTALTSVVDVPNAPLLPRLSLPTIIHPPEGDIPRSASPDELDWHGSSNTLAAAEIDRPRSVSVLSGTSARRSNSIYASAQQTTSTDYRPQRMRLRTGISPLINDLAPGTASTDRTIDFTRDGMSYEIANSLNALTSAGADDDDDELAWLPPRTNVPLAPTSIGSGKPVLLLYCGGSASSRPTKLPSSFFYVDEAPDADEMASARLPPDLRRRVVKLEGERAKRMAERKTRSGGGGCGALICARASATLEPNLFESDCPPRSSAAAWLDIRENAHQDSYNMGGWRLWQSCGCVRANIGCTSCGNAIGYATIRPCTRCSRRYLGQPRYSFCAESVTSMSRAMRRPPSAQLSPSGHPGSTSNAAEDEMLWHTTVPTSTRTQCRIPTRDTDIRAGLAGDPVVWAESSRELLQTLKPSTGSDEASPRRVWLDWLNEDDPLPELPAAGSSQARTSERPWRHHTASRSFGRPPGSSIFFGDPPQAISNRASTIPLLEQAERELEEAERTFMASAAPSIAAGHAADTGAPEERTLERIRSSAPSIVQRARALRRDLRDFVNRIPGQPAEPVSPAGEVSGQRRRRSLSPCEFDEMTDRIMRDARRRRLDGAGGTTTSIPRGTPVSLSASEMVGR